MGWVRRIAFEGDKPKAEIVRCTGEFDVVGVEELSKRGIPAVKGTVKHKAVTTDFSQWKRTDASAYLNGLGFAKANGTDSDHAVFEFSAEGRRYVVPALVLMRAMFRPNRFMLPAMFKPQAVDHLCYPITENSAPTVRPIANWFTKRATFNRDVALGVLTWFSTYNSARDSALSVYEQALRGHVALQLPLGKTKLTLLGCYYANTMYVTDLTVHYVEPAERCVSSSEKPPRRVPFWTNGTKEILPAPVVKTDSTIPLRSCGAVSVTDAEWERIAPILLSGCQISKLSVNQRDLFDGLLEKLRFELPWRKADYRTGSWSAAYQAYRTWKNRGAFDAALAEIRHLRQSR